jgi:hypothetical protein
MTATFSFSFSATSTTAADDIEQRSYSKGYLLS